MAQRWGGRRAEKIPKVEAGAGALLELSRVLLLLRVVVIRSELGN
jgi:hypothetical protein